MHETLEQEVLKQEEQLAAAKRTLDLEALDHIYADGLIMTGVLGEPPCSKPAVLDEARRGIAQREQAASSGVPVEISGSTEDMKVAAYGDTGIASYRFVVNIKGPNMEVRRKYRTTNVWVKRNTQWQIVAAHTAFVLDLKQAAMLEGGS